MSSHAGLTKPSALTWGIWATEGVIGQDGSDWVTHQTDLTTETHPVLRLQKLVVNLVGRPYHCVQAVDVIWQRKKKTCDHIKNSLQDEWEGRRFWITQNLCENYLVMHWQKVEWFLWADGRLRRPFDCQARDWHRSCRDSDLKALSEPPSRSLPNGQVWSWSIVCTGVGKL